MTAIALQFFATIWTSFDWNPLHFERFWFDPFTAVKQAIMSRIQARRYGVVTHVDHDPASDGQFGSNIIR